MNAFIVICVLVVVGIGPFVAVHIGGKAFDADDDDQETNNGDDVHLHMY